MLPILQERLKLKEEIAQLKEENKDVISLFSENQLKDEIKNLNLMIKQLKENFPVLDRQIVEIYENERYNHFVSKQDQTKTASICIL